MTREEQLEAEVARLIAEKRSLVRTLKEHGLEEQVNLYGLRYVVRNLAEQFEAKS